MIARSIRAEVSALLPRALGPAANDDQDAVLDQYYTREDVAKRLYEVFLDHFDPYDFKMVDPSAGKGAFSKLLPATSLAFDLDPKFPGIHRADFLTVKINGRERIAVIGNPPFGKNADLAVRFFNYAARQASVIAFILPRSFRKASINKRIDRHFHLVREEIVPDNAFLFRLKQHNVPTVFQIWVRRGKPREERHLDTRHPDFEFTTCDNADFAIQRVGHNAGRVHHNLGMSPRCHYFIRGPVEAVMKELDFSSVVENVAAVRSLSKSEIVSAYRERVETATEA